MGGYLIDIDILLNLFQKYANAYSNPFQRLLFPFIYSNFSSEMSTSGRSLFVGVEFTVSNLINCHVQQDGIATLGYLPSRLPGLDWMCYLGGLVLLPGPPELLSRLWHFGHTSQVPGTCHYAAPPRSASHPHNSTDSALEPLETLQ